MTIVCLSFYSDFQPRGVETLIHQLATRFSKHHFVTVFQSTKTKTSTYQVNTISSHGLFTFTLKAILKLHQLKPDIILAGNGGWQTLLIKTYTLFTNSKLVISGQAGLGRPDKLNLLLNPAAFVATSQRNLQWAKSFAPKVNLVHIPNGVDLDLFHPQGEKIKLNLSGPIILCVAGPEKYKQVDLTIRAIAKLENTSLLLVGGSVEDDNLGQKLLGSRFQRQNFTHNKMPSVYRSASVFTLMSQSCEAFGIAYLEALASGLPIVAPDDTLRREILGKSAIYVTNPQNLDEYAAKLQKGLSKTLPQPIPDLNRFSWDNISKQYLALFKTLLKYNQD